MRSARLANKILLRLANLPPTRFSSINDKNILKVMFLVGGPGSGKSYVANKLLGKDKEADMSPFGTVISNSDYLFEHMLEEKGLTKDLRNVSPDQMEEIQNVREDAKKKSESRLNNWTNAMLPIVIDGTGKDFEKIKRQADHFRSKGYDVGLNFVDTSLDVALNRNAKRERKVPEEEVKKMWQAVQSNKQKFQDYFGKNFTVTDNSKVLDGAESNKFMNQLFKTGKKFFESHLENPKGKKIVETLKQTGGKSLADLPQDSDKAQTQPAEKPSGDAPAKASWNIAGFAGSPDEKSITVTWETPKVSTKGQVIFGTDKNALDNSMSEKAPTDKHQIKLDDLNPGTTYYLQAISTDQNGAEKRSPVINVATAQHGAAAVDPDNADPNSIQTVKKLGPRGGKIIDYTSTGKPIYKHQHATDYQDFFPADHLDAWSSHKKQGQDRPDHAEAAMSGADKLMQRAK